MSNKFDDVFGLDESDRVDKPETLFNDTDPVKETYIFRPIGRGSERIIEAFSIDGAWKKLQDLKTMYDWKYFVLLGTESYVDEADDPHTETAIQHKRRHPEIE